MIELCCEYLSVRCIWLYVLIMSRTRFRVNPHSIFESRCSHLNFRFRACFEQGVPWHSGNYRVWIHSETRTWHDKNIQSKCTVQISTHNTAQSFGQVWLNGWVFVYELNGCGFESRCSYLNFRFRACFEQGVPWHSGNYRVWIPLWNAYVTWWEHTVKSTVQISTHNTAQSFGQFG